MTRSIAALDRWTVAAQPQAKLEMFILNHVYQELPAPTYTQDDKVEVAQLVSQHIWQKSVRASMTRGEL